jgi:hypothetical protein
MGEGTEKIKVKGPYPPVIFKTDTGTYACAGTEWLKVPEGTKLNAITGTNETPTTETYKVEGSKGNNYTVIYTGDKWSCTCPGYQFRNKCKHIDIAKQGQ